MNIAILGDGLLAQTVSDLICERSTAASDPRVAMLGHDRFDIRSLDSIVAALKPIKPDVIVNTVALHALQRCEDDPNLAYDINARGAGRVARLAPTVYISTDYVFNDKGPHDEVMPGQRPRSEYGRSKLAGELETLEQGGIVVRVSGLYSARYESHKGPSFPTQIVSGYEPVTVASDQRFSPTYAPDAAERIAFLVNAPIWPSGIFHAANAGSTTWAEFAEHICYMARHKRTVIPKAKHDSLRPTDSSLVSKRLPPLQHWMTALKDWSTERDRR